MGLFDFLKSKKTTSDVFDKEGVVKNEVNHFDLYTPELLEWIGATNDPILLACAHHLINTFDWPDYLPKPKPEFDIKGHGHMTTFDYKSNLFTKDLMKQLKEKSEMLSPGLCQALWMTRYYKKYSTKTNKLTMVVLQ